MSVVDVHTMSKAQEFDECAQLQDGCMYKVQPIAALNAFKPSIHNVVESHLSVLMPALTTTSND